MRLPFFNILVIVFFLFIGFISCDKYDDGENTEHIEFAARSLYFELSNHHLMNKLQLGLINQLIPKTVNVDTMVFLNDKIYTIDFGDGFVCKDGIIRRGKILIQKSPDSMQFNQYFISYTWEDSFGIYLSNNWHYIQGSSTHTFFSNGNSTILSQSLIKNSNFSTNISCDSIVFKDIWESNRIDLIGDYLIEGKGSIDGLDYKLNAQVKSNDQLYCPISGKLKWNSWEYDFDPYNEKNIDDWVKITKNSKEYFFHIL